MPRTTPLSPKKLLDYSREHLFYEIWMFRTTAAILAKGGLHPVLKNAVIESFVIHLRNLIDFLYSDNPQPDDVVAADFFDDPKKWSSSRPTMSSTLARARKRANKEIGHLTTRRFPGRDPAKRWEFRSLTNDLRIELRRLRTRPPLSALTPG
jgi:hypothetical protein